MKAMVKTHRTTRFRLHSKTRAKHRLMLGTAGACRYVWNHFVGKLRDDYAYYGECDFRAFSMYKVFTVMRNDDKTTEWLKKYSFSIVRESIKPIEITYKEFFKSPGIKGLPKFKGKYSTNPSFAISKDYASVSGNNLRLPKIGWVSLRRKGMNLYQDGKFVSGRVVLECGKWYAYITYEIEIDERIPTGEQVGIDRNVGQVTLSDGTVYHIPDLARKEARRQRYQRMMARREKGSNRRSLARHRLQKAFQAERQARQFWAHQVSCEVARKYDIVYLEDLNTSGMTASAKGTMENPGTHVAQKTGLNRGILSSSWHKLEHYLAYKTKIEKVPAKYTSQKCNVCGFIDAANRKTQANFKCLECGHEDNADVNAALNILASVTGATGHGGGEVTRPVKCQRDSEFSLIS